MKSLFVGALLASSVLPAFAAISLVNYDGFAVVQSGNTWNFHHESPENSALKGGTVYGRAGSSVSTTQPLTVTGRDVVPVGKGAVIDVVAKVPRANFAKALVASAKIAGAVALPAVAGLALEAMLDYGLKNVRLGDDGSLVADGNPANSEVSTGQVWKWNAIGGPWPTANTPEGLCAKVANGGRYTYNNYFCSAWDQSGSYLGGASVSASAGTCAAGKYIWPDGTCSVAPAPMTEQELSDFLATRTTGWPTSSAIALQAMLSYPDTRKIITPYPDNGVTLIGQPFVEGKTSTNTDIVQLVPGTNTVAPPGATQTQTGTRTSTTTTTHPLTYAGNSVKSSTVNNTTTNITNNTTNITTTETKTETVEDDSDEQSPVDAPLPNLPSLYEKKYPEGLSGVWSQRNEEFKSSGLFSLAEQLMPTSLNGGTCPNFSLDLSIGLWADYGTHEVPMPCWIWDTCKYILLLMAAVSARRIVLGG